MTPVPAPVLGLAVLEEEGAVTKGNLPLEQGHLPVLCIILVTAQEEAVSRTIPVDHLTPHWCEEAGKDAVFSE